MMVQPINPNFRFQDPNINPHNKLESSKYSGKAPDPDKFNPEDYQKISDEMAALQSELQKIQEAHQQGASETEIKKMIAQYQSDENDVRKNLSEIAKNYHSEAIDDFVEGVNKQLDSNDDALNKIPALLSDIDAAKQRIQQDQSQLDTLNPQASSLNKQIAADQAQLDAERKAGHDDPALQQKIDEEKQNLSAVKVKIDQLTGELSTDTGVIEDDQEAINRDITSSAFNIEMVIEKWLPNYKPSSEK